MRYVSFTHLAIAGCTVCTRLPEMSKSLSACRKIPDSVIHVAEQVTAQLKFRQPLELGQHLGNVLELVVVQPNVAKVAQLRELIWKVGELVGAQVELDQIGNRDLISATCSGVMAGMSRYEMLSLPCCVASCIFFAHVASSSLDADDIFVRVTGVVLPGAVDGNSELCSPKWAPATGRAKGRRLGP